MASRLPIDPLAPATIYGLFDPRGSLQVEEVRYIGMTTTPLNQRLKSHVGMAVHEPHRGVCAWILELALDNIQPVIQPLETTLAMHRGDREKAWIARGRQEGWDLVNGNDGGYGQSPGWRMTDEQRAELSRIVKQRHIDDPGIAERKRAGQQRRYADPAERRRTGERISAAIAVSDQSDKYCPECNKGPFRGTWGLAAHISYDHDPEPTNCEDCHEGPFIGTAGLAAHRAHKHIETMPLMCGCGEGPFDGSHGLGIHQARFCNLTTNGRLEQSQRLTAVYAGNTELRALISERVTMARAAEDKTASWCDICASGPFKGPRALQIHQARKGCVSC